MPPGPMSTPIANVSAALRRVAAATIPVITIFIACSFALLPDSSEQGQLVPWTGHIDAENDRSARGCGASSEVYLGAGVLGGCLDSEALPTYLKSGAAFS